ncbi:tyrosine--tRNA ligase [Litorilinea aerophila]|nr:tyrosine--tRNA ligase [Litorilinea aerophila]MCC9078254.1 tyrosine--tRNA ligase [Litorilinea aerophila]GIV77474.1 MAG: tyrosine--tRNA ligase [Litorilinea sp.]
MAKFPPVHEQMRILMRGVDFGDEQTYVNMERELRERLEESYNTGRPLKVYCGYDPSSPDLHLGHTITMRKLRQFQDLGHDVTFLIGTFTGIIGDPSDKESVRKQQTLEEALAKAKTYAEQAWRILDPEKTRVRYNHEWLSKLTFGDVIQLASHFTVQQFLARDNFQKRYQNGDAIWLHEFFYALMQGYDAVALETDVQIGGTDQLFNLMAGRKLMEAFGLRPQVVLTSPILVGTDGVMRMSKSAGNYIGIDEPPGVIFTKVLNVPDTAMRNYAELVTRWSQEEIDEMFRQIEAGTLDMRTFKHRLAREIVSIFHGEEAAEQAARDAARMHAGEAPSDAPTFQLQEALNIVELLHRAGLVKSKSEGRRLIQQGGVRINGETVADLDQVVQVPNGQELVIQAGKRKFLRVTRG